MKFFPFSLSSVQQLRDTDSYCVQMSLLCSRTLEINHFYTTGRKAKVTEGGFKGAATSSIN